MPGVLWRATFDRQFSFARLPKPGCNAGFSFDGGVAVPTLSRRSLMIASASSVLLPKSAQSQEAQPPTSSPAQTAPVETPKPKDLSFAQQIEHTAVLMRTVDGKSKQFTGTGFFFNFFLMGNQSLTTIVTNKHVVAGMKKLNMRWTRSTAAKGPDIGNLVDVEINDVEQRLINHPDPNVDLAVIAISDLLNKYESENRPIYAVGASEQLIQSESDLKKFQPLEEILVVGFPDGYSDSKNNIPIFRRGVTATPVYLRFENKKQFMIDAAIYHGSSGSPVFLYNVGAWIDENGHPVLGTRVGLLGVVWGVFESATEGEIRILPAPTQFQQKAVSPIPHNLGACVPAYCILDFEPEIVKRGYKPPDGYKMRAQP
jgi:Trypsin-like peptidase domain